LIKFEAFCTKNEDSDQIYLNTGSKTQTGQKSIKTFSVENRAVLSVVDIQQYQILSP
jgi:hypothetical protein